ncbi:hypothetical protein TSOC_005357 [Tetrabaena socialis]|uniref:Uncharacterized protein n=1 Tax=Tetrabaena socialis TaxID=47790 RepID=A0A2J8A6H1_9CHLO|nr:hypothetical protein TSOC_005357 [Tetrabaena socialis]|eukprot:PNH08118.1 hypothetical protein TSOC_005357 [Tetrabaena socialis]
MLRALITGAWQGPHTTAWPAHASSFKHRDHRGGRSVAHDRGGSTTGGSVMRACISSSSAPSSTSASSQMDLRARGGGMDLRFMSTPARLQR